MSRANKCRRLCCKSILSKQKSNSNKTKVLNLVFSNVYQDPTRPRVQIVDAIQDQHQANFKRSSTPRGQAMLRREWRNEQRTTPLLPSTGKMAPKAVRSDPTSVSSLLPPHVIVEAWMGKSLRYVNYISNARDDVVTDRYTKWSMPSTAPSKTVRSISEKIDKHLETNQSTNSYSYVQSTCYNYI